MVLVVHAAMMTAQVVALAGMMTGRLVVAASIAMTVVHAVMMTGRVAARAEMMIVRLVAAALTVMTVVHAEKMTDLAVDAASTAMTDLAAVHVVMMIVQVVAVVLIVMIAVHVAMMTDHLVAVASTVMTVLLVVAVSAVTTVVHVATSIARTPVLPRNASQTKLVAAPVDVAQPERCQIRQNALAKTGLTKDQLVQHVALQVFVQKQRVVRKRADARKFAHLIRWSKSLSVPLVHAPLFVH